MEQFVIVHQPRLIRQRNIAQQLLRDGVEARERNDIAGKWLVRCWIEDLGRCTGEITLALELRWHRGNLGGRVLCARSEIAHKKSGGRVLDKLRNYQRTARNHTEAALRIRRLRDVLARNGKWLGVERRVVQCEKHHTVNAIGLPSIAKLPALLTAFATASKTAS